MKKIKYLLIIISLSAFAISNSFSKNNITLDEEDKKLKEDLYLNDSEFFKKYVDKFKATNSEFLYTSYITTDDPEIKIYLLRTAAQKGLNDEFIAKLIILGLTESTWNFNYHDRMAISQSWKVRAAAAYIIEENADKVENKNKTSFAKQLLLNIDNDPEERVRGISALALGKLFAKENYDNKDKTFVVHTLVNYLAKMNSSAQFLAWSIVKSLGYLQDQRGFYPLLQARKNKINQKITLEISRSLNAIINSGSTKK